MFSAGVKVDYEDGSSEIIPILPWTGSCEGFTQHVYVLKQRHDDNLFSLLLHGKIKSVGTPNWASNNSVIG
ncbi:MAG: hypothetical protein QXS21_01065 [Thermoproteota archaeon]|nr:hypothetical protein [Candidatus Brockarchaeota archaeon]